MEIMQEVTIASDNHSVVKCMRQELLPRRAWAEKTELGMKEMQAKKWGRISEVTAHAKKAAKVFLQNIAVSGF